MKRSHLTLALWGSLFGVFLPPARGDVINFSGLTGVEAPIPNLYAGFTWNNFSSLNTQTDVNVMPSGYAFANTDSASPNVAFNLYGDPASIVSATPFSLYGGFFTAAWRDNLTIEAQGFLNGTQLYDQTFTVNSTGPTFEYLNFQSIDTVRFTSSGGTVHGYVPLKPASHPPLTQFAMDDLVVTTSNSVGGPVIAEFSTPEPTSFVLFAGGVLLAGLLVRPCREGRTGATAGE
jgi:hypothetical protein